MPDDLTHEPMAWEPGGATGLRRTELVARLCSPPSEERVAVSRRRRSATDPRLRVRRTENNRLPPTPALSMGVLAHPALGAFGVAGLSLAASVSWRM